MCILKFEKSEKTGIDDLIYKAEIETQMQKTNIWTQGGDEINWEIGIDVNTLLTLCIKQITNENLLYSSRNPTQCSVVT